MKVVLATSGTLGDHLPVFSLAKLLSAKGVTTIVACNPVFENVACSLGLAVIALGEKMGDLEVNDSPSSWDQWIQAPNEAINGNKSRIRITSTIDVLVQIVTKSDLLISTRNIPFISLVANITQCQWVEIGLNSISMTDCIAFDNSNSRKSPIRAQYESLAISIRDHFARSLSASSDPSPTVRLHAVPTEFIPNDYPQVDCVATGFWLSEPLHLRDWKPTPNLERALDVSPKPLGIIFSSLPLYDPVYCLQKHIQIARILERPLVVVKGWSFGQAAQAKCTDLRKLMSNTEIIDIDPVPLSWLLPRIAVSFIHGGMGTLSQSLKAECMTVIEPYGNDQFLNARLAMKSGLAKAIHPYRINPAEVADTIALCLDRPRKRLPEASFEGLQVSLDYILELIRDL